MGDELLVSPFCSISVIEDLLKPLCRIVFVLILSVGECRQNCQLGSGESVVKKIELGCICFSDTQTGVSCNCFPSSDTQLEYLATAFQIYKLEYLATAFLYSDTHLEYPATAFQIYNWNILQLLFRYTNWSIFFS